MDCMECDMERCNLVCKVDHRGSFVGRHRDNTPSSSPFCDGTSGPLKFSHFRVDASSSSFLFKIPIDARVVILLAVLIAISLWLTRGLRGTPRVL